MTSAMPAVRATLTRPADPGPGPTEQTAFVVRDPIQPGQCYLLPSGARAVVVAAGISNVQLAYVPGELVLRRDAFSKMARRVLGTGST
jgi:hypothetical protein